MPVVRLKGLKKVSVTAADGRRVVYWYAWAGGPRLEGAPGTPEFLAAYNRAVAARKAPTHQTLATLVGRYRAAPEFKNLGASTRAEWSRWLKRIERDDPSEALDIGGMPLKALDDRRTRGDLLEWRDQFADRPRAADYAVQVLSRVLAFGADRGLLQQNIMTGVAQLYESDRADQIWTPDEIARFTAAAKSPEVGFIVRLACLTGLRREDLTRLAWSHVGDVAIVLPTGKSRRKGGRARKDAVVPLIDETRELLAEIKAQQTRRHAALVARTEKKKLPPPPEPLTVLSNTRGRPWSPDGLEHQVIDTKTTAKIEGRHLHDGRGTLATRLRLAGLKAAEIADVLGWEEDRVERLLSVYVDRETVVRSIAVRLQKRSEGEP